MKKLLFAILTGAGMAYFLDPDNGTRRRDKWQRRLGQSKTSTKSVASTPPRTPSASTTNSTSSHRSAATA